MPALIDGFARRQDSNKAWWESWNGLEAKQLDPSASLEAWMAASSTDFTVSLRNLYFNTKSSDPWFNMNQSPLGNAVVRDDNNHPLAHVGNQYKPIQNHEMFEMMRDYIDHDIVDVETIGSLRGGLDTFLLGKFKEADYFLPGNDRITNYLLISVSHGQTANRLKLVTVRVVCANTLAQALNQSKGLDLKFSHRSEFNGMHAKMDAGIALDQILKRRCEATTLAATKVDTSWAQEYFKTILGNPAKSIDEQPKAVYKSLDLFDHSGIGSNLASSKNTAWGAFNAVTEYVDHHRGQPASRQFQALLGNGADIKAQAYDTAIKMIS